MVDEKEVNDILAVHSLSKRSQSEGHVSGYLVSPLGPRAVDGRALLATSGGREGAIEIFATIDLLSVRKDVTYEKTARSWQIFVQNVAKMLAAFWL